MDASRPHAAIRRLMIRDVLGVNDCCSRLAWGLVLTGALFAAEPSAGTTTVIHSDLHTAKTVRGFQVSPRTVAEQRVTETVVAARVVSPLTPGRPVAESSEPAGIDQTIDRIAAAHQLSAQLVHSVIQVESNYDPYAISPKGALGLMQLIPSTARRFGVSDVFNPKENIEAGVTYLQYLLNLFGGDYRLALAAYNAGEASVARYSGVPPFPETQNYVARVFKQWTQTRKAAPRQTKEILPLDLKNGASANANTK